MGRLESFVWVDLQRQRFRKRAEQLRRAAVLADLVGCCCCHAEAAKVAIEFALFARWRLLWRFIAPMGCVRLSHHIRLCQMKSPNRHSHRMEHASEQTDADEETKLLHSQILGLNAYPVLSMHLKLRRH